MNEHNQEHNHHDTYSGYERARRDRSRDDEGRKQGYIEIRPLTKGGPGLRAVGFDMETHVPVPGCVETAMDEDNGLVSALLDVNECMHEQGYAVVKKFTHYVDQAQDEEPGEGAPPAPEKPGWLPKKPNTNNTDTGDSEMKSVMEMSDREFQTYLQKQRDLLSNLENIAGEAGGPEAVADTPDVESVPEPESIIDLGDIGGTGGTGETESTDEKPTS